MTQGGLDSSLTNLVGLQNPLKLCPNVYYVDLNKQIPTADLILQI